MMYGYGSWWPWMMLMPLLWIAFLALIIWGVSRLVARPGDPSSRRETPQEILDRRFAQGEIDADVYTSTRAHLGGHAAR